MTLTTPTMWAVRVPSYGGPEQLKLERVERPHPQAGEVLLRAQEELGPEVIISGGSARMV